MKQEYSEIRKKVPTDGLDQCRPKSEKPIFFPGLPYSPSIYQWNNFVGAEL